MSQITPSLTNLPPEVLALLGSTPAIPPPEGVTSNFVHPHSKGSTQITVTSAILGIMLLFFINRLYVKALLTKKVTWDDGTITLGMFGCVAYYVACIWGAQKGRIGIHEWDISILQASSLDLLINGSHGSIKLMKEFTASLPYYRSYTPHFPIYQDEFLHLVSAGLQSATVASNLFLVRLGYNGDNTSEAEKRITQLSVPQSVVPSDVTKKKVWSDVDVLFWCHGLCMLNLQHLLSTYFNRERGHNMAPNTCKYINSMYWKLIRVMSIPFVSLRSTLRESKNSSISSRIPTRQKQKSDEENVLKSTDRKYARYFNLDILTSGSTGIQNTGTSMTTITGSPQARATEAKGIQRQIDIDIEDSQVRRSVNR
ncbi:hypothetical protein DSL72_001583 [Monilinia vaccinii-corymbosi]|uniref:Uncharacterized protein n=1 Tax=Monilinia vaccinii-corymbosi TaxID=61207 RepID=A0A8A3P665_9HELO|nr:hypothetical protein DSL72_001583 [Monilinia vaccinii-corymbosi]